MYSRKFSKMPDTQKKHSLWYCHVFVSQGFSQVETPDRQSVRGVSYTLVCTLKDRV